MEGAHKRLPRSVAFTAMKHVAYCHIIHTHLYRYFLQIFVCSVKFLRRHKHCDGVLPLLSPSTNHCWTRPRVWLLRAVLGKRLMCSLGLVNGLEVVVAIMLVELAEKFVSQTYMGLQACYKYSILHCTRCSNQHRQLHRKIIRDCRNMKSKKRLCPTISCSLCSIKSCSYSITVFDKILFLFYHCAPQNLVLVCHYIVQNLIIVLSLCSI